MKLTSSRKSFALFLNINFFEQTFLIVTSLEKKSFIDWAPNLPQNNYANLTLSPNDFKLNQETV
jgi:hypothetical protein